MNNMQVYMLNTVWYICGFFSLPVKILEVSNCCTILGYSTTQRATSLSQQAMRRGIHVFFMFLALTLMSRQYQA